MAYAFKGLAPQADFSSHDVALIASELAGTGESTLRDLPSGCKKDEVLNALLQNGFVVQLDGGLGWSLTDLGKQRLSFGWTLERPTLVCMPREIPIADKTEWELVHALREDGWVWQRWVPPSQRRKRGPVQPEAYYLGEPKIWFTSGTSVCWSYLCVLLQAPALVAEGLSMVPHGREAALYDRILTGNFDLSKRKRAVALHMLEDVIEGGPQDVPALQDEHAFPEAGNPEDGESEDLEPSDQEGNDEAASEGDEDDGGGDLATDGGADPLGDGASDADAAEPAADAQPDHPAAVEQVLRSGRFGIFRMTPKQPSDRIPFGGYEASCPFHRKNSRTGCKKFCRMTEAGPAARRDTLLRLMHWCTLAVYHNRQRKHLWHFPELDECPLAHVILARRINEPPDDAVRTDEEIDLDGEDSV